MQQPTRTEVRWEWISQGWELFTKQWQNWVVISLVAFIITAIPAVPLYIFLFGAQLAAGSQNSDRPEIGALMTGASFLLQVLFAIVISAVSMIVLGGMFKAAFKQLRGEQISVSDFFSVTENIVPLVITGVIVSILETIGTYLCIIPGLIVLGLMIFAIPLVIDRNVGPADALRMSLEVTKQNWIMFTVFAFVMRLLMGVGVIACCVGLLATVPLYILTIAVAYRDCLGLPGASTPDSYSPPPPPNYGGYEPPPPSNWQ